jgi:hypothetical protein
VEACILIRSIVPARPNDTVKMRIVRAAKLLNWKQGRAEDIWWRAARRIEAWEMDQLRRFVPRDE